MDIQSNDILSSDGAEKSISTTKQTKEDEQSSSKVRAEFMVNKNFEDIYGDMDKSQQALHASRLETQKSLLCLGSMCGEKENPEVLSTQMDSISEQLEAISEEVNLSLGLSKSINEALCASLLQIGGIISGNKSLLQTFCSSVNQKEPSAENLMESGLKFAPETWKMIQDSLKSFQSDAEDVSAEVLESEFSSSEKDIPEYVFEFIKSLGVEELEKLIRSAAGNLHGKIADLTSADISVQMQSSAPRVQSIVSTQVQAPVMAEASSSDAMTDAEQAIASAKASGLVFGLTGSDAFSAPASSVAEKNISVDAPDLGHMEPQPSFKEAAVPESEDPSDEGDYNSLMPEPENSASEKDREFMF